MEVPEYLKRMREYLHDPDGKVWDEKELIDFLNDAAIQYCRDTGSFRSTANILVDSSGMVRMPKVYLEWVAGWNNLDQKIEAVSLDVVSDWYGDFTTVRGTAKFAYEDMDTIGNFKLCPNPIDIAGTITIIVLGRGIPVEPTRGIPTRAELPGIPVQIMKGQSVGQMVYVKSESVEKIVDYMAILYLSISMAYDVDSDFQDNRKSAMYYEQYKNRIARFGQIRRGGNQILGGGHFF